MAARSAQRLRADLAAIADAIEPGSRVLDLGCGNGDLMAYLEETKQVRAQGIEIRPERVVECVAKGLSVCHGDIDGGLSDFADDSVDYVVLSQTLHLVSSPGLVVREMLRVGCCGIVSIPNFGYWRIRVGLLLRGRIPRVGCFTEPWYVTPTGHVMTLSDFSDFAGENGIIVARRRYVTSGGLVAGVAARGLPNLFAQLGVFLVSTPERLGRPCLCAT